MQLHSASAHNTHLHHVGMMPLVLGVGRSGGSSAAAKWRRGAAFLLGILLSLWSCQVMMGWGRLAVLQLALGCIGLSWCLRPGSCQGLLCRVHGQRCLLLLGCTFSAYLRAFSLPLCWRIC